MACLFLGTSHQLAPEMRIFLLKQTHHHLFAKLHFCLLQRPNGQMCYDMLMSESDWSFLKMAVPSLCSKFGFDTSKRSWVMTSPHIWCHFWLTVIEERFCLCLRVSQDTTTHHNSFFKANVNSYWAKQVCTYCGALQWSNEFLLLLFFSHPQDGVLSLCTNVGVITSKCCWNMSSLPAWWLHRWIWLAVIDEHFQKSKNPTEKVWHKPKKSFQKI